MTVKVYRSFANTAFNFSNWIIYVTVKAPETGRFIDMDFSNWIIYVTVKVEEMSRAEKAILVTE